MTFYPTDRLALFIDGANLYSAAKGLGFDIDYRKLLEEFRKRGVLVRAYYYTALVEDQEYSPIRPLVDWLDYNGFRLVTKPAREYTDAQGRKRWRGDMDVEIAVDMMEMASHADHLVLFSGDGDFRVLVEAVQRRGARSCRHCARSASIRPVIAFEVGSVREPQVSATVPSGASSTLLKFHDGTKPSLSASQR